MAFPIPLPLRDEALRQLGSERIASPMTSEGSADVPLEYWRAPIAGILSTLGANEKGLSSPEASRRLALTGPNILFQQRRRRLAVDLARRLGNPLVLMLLAAATVAGATGDSASFILIVAMVLLSTILDPARRQGHGSQALQTLQHRDARGETVENVQRSCLSR